MRSNTLRWKLFATVVGCVLVAALAAVASTPQAVRAQTVRLYGTEGYGGTLATLVEIDPATGAFIDTIGPVGYTINGLTWDPTTDTLYGGGSLLDPSHNGLMTIDRTTGAGTPIGPSGWGLGGAAITNITVNSAGDMYGWTESTDDLVRIDKGTGIATVVGDSGLGTAQNGMSFNPADVLYMINFDGRIYDVNTATGSATAVGSLGRVAHHGDFHPVDGTYYGLTWTFGSPREMMECDIVTQTCTTIGPVRDLHTLTFLVEGEVPPTPVPGGPRPVGGFEVGAVVPVLALDAQGGAAAESAATFAMSVLGATGVPASGALGLIVLFGVGVVVAVAAVGRRRR